MIGLSQTTDQVSDKAPFHKDTPIFCITLFLHLQMGVTIRKLPVVMMKTGSKDPKEKSAWKLRPTVSDLPLPRSSGYIQDWHKKFVPLLISWAGSQIDLFGTNGHIDGAIKSV